MKFRVCRSFFFPEIELSGLQQILIECISRCFRRPGRGFSASFIRILHRQALSALITARHTPMSFPAAKSSDRTTRDVAARPHHRRSATISVLIPTPLPLIGGGVPEVSQALGIVATTVKTHLGRLFEKTGADRQADLVKVVAGFATPLVG
jgi:hypothetical protein